MASPFCFKDKGLAELGTEASEGPRTQTLEKPLCKGPASSAWNQAGRVILAKTGSVIRPSLEISGSLLVFFAKLNEFVTMAPSRGGGGEANAQGRLSSWGRFKIVRNYVMLFSLRDSLEVPSP